ncbi:MAG TPA: PaaI family thioesterase [Spirochaetia bacterium]|nr:PaaI family thioesterase [Spirochaetia bacterium]
MNERLIDLFKQDRYAARTGIELLEASEGHAKARLNVTEDHHNFVKTLHGGAIFTLADYVFAVASNSHGTVSVAINASISYIKPVFTGILFAEAKEVSLSNRLANYNVDVTDENGELIANFRGMVYRKRESLIQEQ